MDRQKQIIRISIIGIAVNLALVAAKAAIGFLSNSIAILLDAVNNLSDVLSSVITIIGTKIAGKKPDKKHPFGHGRVEYITSLLIAAMVLLAGITSAKESVDKILNPVDTVYTTASLAVIVLAILTKFFLGRFVSGQGKKLNSQALIASGMDASFDSLLTLSTLIAAVVRLATGLKIEGIIGVLISVFILKAGLEILTDSLSAIIGARVDPELSAALKETVGDRPEVLGVYDLILNRYGPETIIGSVHVEVPDELTAVEIHHLTRHISEDIYREFGIILTVGIYASNTNDPESAAMLAELREIVETYPQVLQLHGFFWDKEDRQASFDLVMDFAEEDPQGICEQIKEEIAAKHPDVTFYAVIDSDFSD